MVGTPLTARQWIDAAGFTFRPPGARYGDAFGAAPEAKPTGKRPMTAVDISAAECARNITLKCRITGLKALSLRFWIAARLMHLVAWVAGLGGIEVEAA